MKKFILLVSVILIPFFVCAQKGTIGHLRYKLNIEADDTAKAITLDSLFMYYLFFTDKPDSSFFYANKLINYSFNLKDKKYLILGYAHMGFYYMNESQYRAALDISLKGIRLSELYQIPDYLSALYYNISWVYYSLGNLSSAQKNAFEGIRYIKYNKDPFYDQPLHILGMIGNNYLELGNPDSALHYLKLTDSLANVSKELAARDVVNWYWALYYIHEKNYSSADSVLSLAIASCEKNGDFLIGYFHYFLAQSYFSDGKLHEAIASCHSAIKFATSINDKQGAQLVASLLQACYDKLGNRDSAYYYIKMSDSLNSAVLSKGNLNEVEQVEFNEQLGQKQERVTRALQDEKNKDEIIMYVFLTSIVFFLVITAIQWRNNLHKKKANLLLEQQKEKIEHTLAELKSAQAQLVQSEKMASLGELTAGIAHEIQNPLNFVNNFSDVNSELIGEMQTEMDKGNIADAKTILNEIKENEEKINHHGKRAGAIVKGMLQHSQKKYRTERAYRY